MLTVVALVVGLGVGAVVAAVWLRTASGSAVRRSEDDRRRVVADAEREAETIRREALVEAREGAVKLRAEVESEVRDRRVEIAKVEERIAQREAELDEKLIELTRREQGVGDREVHLKQLQEEQKASRDRSLEELERISGMTQGEAKAAMLERSQDLVRHELARSVRQMEEEARGEARRRARALVADALQRVAASHTAETTVTVVELASDDMKGRIIGREGRNIRALEHLTGVDVIVDDTPHAVVLSSFDGIRREIAKLTLEKLIEDGRIHPARIEEMYYQSKAELDEQIHQAGTQAVFEANCGEFNEELVAILGRLRYRTSYGQNVLKHTLEVVHLAGTDGRGARRRREDGEARRGPARHRQGHDARGGGFARARLGPARAALRGIGGRRPCDRGSPLRGSAADGRGGARHRRRRGLGFPSRRAGREPRALHQAALGAGGDRDLQGGRVEGVALQAGREIRVIVEPSEVDDDGTALLSYEIARQIEDQLEYPGQVKVIVIRESRAIEVAK